MRDLASEPKTAYRYLGSGRGQAFIGLLADFRAALFAGDVPMGPISTKRVDGTFQLDWFVSADCTLVTVIAVSGDGDEAWKDAHRIQLKYVEMEGEVLA